MGFPRLHPIDRQLEPCQWHNESPLMAQPKCPLSSWSIVTSTFQPQGTWVSPYSVPGNLIGLNTAGGRVLVLLSTREPWPPAPLRSSATWREALELFGSHGQRVVHGATGLWWKRGSTCSGPKGQGPSWGRAKWLGRPVPTDARPFPLTLRAKHWRACHSHLIPAHCLPATGALGCHLPCTKSCQGKRMWWEGTEGCPGQEPAAQGARRAVAMTCPQMAEVPVDLQVTETSGFRSVCCLALVTNLVTFRFPKMKRRAVSAQCSLRSQIALWSPKVRGAALSLWGSQGSMAGVGLCGAHCPGAQSKS